MRGHDLMWVLAVGVLGLGLVSPVAAQDAPAIVAPDPAYQELNKRLQAAETELRALKLQQQREAQSPEKVKAAYAERFKAAKEQAGPGCQDAGGKLRVEVDEAGKIKIACQW